MFLIHTDNQVDVIWRFDSSLADQHVWLGSLLLTLFAHAILKTESQESVCCPLAVAVLNLKHSNNSSKTDLSKARFRRRANVDGLN